MSNLVHKEKIKLTATLCNNLAVTSVATSWFVPLVSVIGRMDRLEIKDIVVYFFSSTILGAGLFIVFGRLALRQLDKLKE
jgi:hypothetical protein